MSIEESLQPKETYRSGKIAEMATNPTFFRKQLPSIVSDVVESNNQSIFSNASTRVLEQMRRQMRGFWEEGSSNLLDSLSGNFARRQGWMTEVKMGTMRFKAPLNYNEFSEERKAKWKEYRFNDGISREDATEAVERLILIHFNQLPSVHNLGDPILEAIRDRFSKVPLQLALKIFPDMTDNEARKLLNYDSADDVRKRAEKPTEEES